MRPGAFRRQSMIFTKRQVIHPASGELMLLVEARKTAIRRDIERVLRNNHSAKSD